MDFQEIIKILLVDDDETHREVFAKRLVSLGYQILQAGTAQDANQILNSCSLDLVILDLHLPDANGLDILKQIRVKHSLINLPVIMLTGSIDSYSVIDALNNGANDYITKPTDFSVAVARIKTHLTIRHQELELENQRSRAIGSAKILALGEMAAGIAHEINNPLAIICSNTSILTASVMKLPPEQQEPLLSLLKVTEKTGFKVAKIIDAIEKFSRVADKESLKKIPVEEFIRDAVLLCDPKLKNGRIGLFLPEKFPDVEVLCRSVEMAQVIYSLLSNASDAVADLEERWVRIDVEVCNPAVTISVTDSGNGIAPEIESRIFQPFFTTKSLGKGAGLGLSQTLGIVKSFGGTLEVDHASHNTRFIIQLPQAI